MYIDCMMYTLLLNMGFPHKGKERNQDEYAGQSRTMFINEAKYK